MRVLVSPQWSFGRDRKLLCDCRDLLVSHGAHVHYCESDIDHNRTVTAYSGEAEVVRQATLGLCELILPAIDLNRHVGVHPRTGALDLVPVHPLDPVNTRLRAARLNQWIAELAGQIADRYELPVFLYEKSESSRSEAEIPAVREGGFGSLLDRDLGPDFGPRLAHPHLGVAILGWADWQLSVNVNLSDPDPRAAKLVAHRIRDMRGDGDGRMLGVRASGWPLLSREMSQVSLLMTLPDLTPADPVLEYVYEACDRAAATVAYTELVGAIRDSDLSTATRLHPRPEQIVSIGGTRAVGERGTLH